MAESWVINIKFLDLFAGIGGFRSGLEMAGHECVGYVEIDEFARKSYQAIYDTKGEYTEHDIRKIDTTKLPEADIWTFGFPCQDISVAGKQKGFAGERSSLFFAVTGKLRQLEDEQKPSYLLIENVKNLLSINGGRDFGKLQIELDEIGYDVEWDVLDTAEVLPQHRERVYIVGHFRGRRTRNVFPITTKGQQSNNEVKQVGNLNPDGSFGGNPQVGRVYATDGISPTLNTMTGGGREPKIAVHETTLNGLRIRKLTPLEAWRLQGFPDWAFDKAQEVNSNSQLYKQAGNSVTVPVVYAVASRL